MVLEVPWDGLWTLSFGLSQSHGHGTWLVYEVVHHVPTFEDQRQAPFEPLKLVPFLCQIPLHDSTQKLERTS